MGVKELIRVRGLHVGDRLPSYNELIKELSFSLVTVKRGIDDLVAEGVILRQHGRGTFVAKELARMPRTLAHIGLIYPSSQHFLFKESWAAKIMQGVSRASPPGADMHIFSMREGGLVDAAQLGEWAVDGALLLNVENDDYLRAFATWGTPGVVVDYCSQAAPLDYVACDNRAAAQRVVEYLAAQGHSRVVYAGPPLLWPVKRPEKSRTTLLVKESSDVRERRDESVHALRERNLLAEVWQSSHTCKLETWTFCAADELQGRIRAADGPTVVLTDNNYSAFLLLHEFARCSLRVPEDVSVCAVASDVDTVFKGRQLTSCRFDFVGMGRKAMDLLAVRCTEPALEKPCVHRIGFEFVEGQTVRNRNKEKE